MIRDLFGDPIAGNPMESARRGARPARIKRFYKQANAGQREGAFAILLDGKPALTPAKRPLALPSRALAEAVAAEWAAQGEHIDPATMPLTRLAHAAIDGVAGGAKAVAAEIERYAGSDLVLYRATEPEGLIAVQAKHWDPVLAWAIDMLGARFTPVKGVKHVAQPEAAIKAVRAEIASYKSPFQLAALASLTNISGSALLALALGRGQFSADEAWAAAHVDEDWNVKRWGEDAEAVARRAARRIEFDAAARMLNLG
jgi:chaperone required for assembly of F1-ATPase